MHWFWKSAWVRLAREQTVLVALVTPMAADGEVDWPAVEKHMDDVITAGADGIVVTGTTGETSTLTDAEKIRLVEVGKDVAAGRAKIITGGGSNETAHAIELYKASEKVGADGIMIVTPYYNKPTQAGILTHFRLVADATDLPVILYDIPGRTGVPIKYETILRLAKHPNILAIKDAKGDFSEVSRVLNQTDLMYFSGDDANVLPHLSQHGLEERVLLLLGQDVDTLHERKTGVDHHRELACEHGKLFGSDLLSSAQLRDRNDASFFRRLRHYDLLAPQQ